MTMLTPRLVAQLPAAVSDSMTGFEAAAGSECLACQAGNCQGTECQTGRRNRARLLNRQQCPQCDCSECFLVVAPADVWNTCYQTEQKVVCIPQVRFPWQQDCPPAAAARNRVVTVLKTHTYKCPGCSYQWTDRVPAPVAAPIPAQANVPAEVPIITQVGQRLARVNSESAPRPTLRSILFTDNSLPPQPGFENSLPAAENVPPITVIQR